MPSMFATHVIIAKQVIPADIIKFNMLRAPIKDYFFKI